ncbi:hypothetical protein RUM43_006390 [Polyplax serrata]|uniref:Uncharacterized protein n=1 Tax=Polyplax serrata TaxID=468196 RepID=A0AAN8PBC8_POLSC
MDNTKSLQRFPGFSDENGTGERQTNSIFEELSRSSFTSNYNGKLESFSALFQLAKLRLVVLMMSKEFQLLLPSDQAWRLKNYFKLLNQQKEKTLILHM